VAEWRADDRIAVVGEKMTPTGMTAIVFKNFTTGASGAAERLAAAPRGETAAEGDAEGGMRSSPPDLLTPAPRRSSRAEKFGPAQTGRPKRKKPGRRDVWRFDQRRKAPSP
jgi:hypothetical protein